MGCARIYCQPPHLARHFLAGFWDGDGTIAEDVTPRFYGTEPRLLEYADRALRCLALTTYIYREEPTRTVNELGIVREKQSTFMT
ncbi:MAG: hypothetical protein AOA65_1657 [Candidatus Bathyarchaeota archaeon BA1]|nr:MAG: hypothetical protein AOA65_1657 [Candidatus Bathyarchaeota archaeon BA1]